MKISSIFSSINGEVSGNKQGSLCVFVRMQGCNCCCSYCDTKQSQDIDKGTEMSIKEVYDKIMSYNIPSVTITGGEPLLQKEELKKLVKKLDDNKIFVSIETNGSFKIPSWVEVDSWVADWKTPSSGMRDKMKISNLGCLSNIDFIKFVIKDKKDFEDALSVMSEMKEIKNCTLDYEPKYVFSPLYGVLEPALLTAWMLNNEICRSKLAILNLQIHKLINVL